MQKLKETRLAKRFSKRSSAHNVIHEYCDQDSCFQKVFANTSEDHEKISLAYQQYMEQREIFPLIHIGICLQYHEFEEMYQTLFSQKFLFKQQFFHQKAICYLKHMNKQFEGMKIVLWIYPFDDSQLSPSTAAFFWGYPEIVVTNQGEQAHDNANIFSEKEKGKLKALFGYETSLIFFNKLKEKDDRTLKDQLQDCIRRCAKKNSYRLMSSAKTINLYMINQIMSYRHQKVNLISSYRIPSLPEGMLIEETIYSFLDEEIEKKYDRFYEEVEQLLPLSRHTLNSKIQDFQQYIINKLRINLLLFLPQKKVQQYVQEAQIRLQQMKEQLIYKNEELGTVKNKKLSQELFGEFYAKIDTNMYSKEEISQICDNFTGLLDDYDENNVEIEGNFDIFNNCMKKNRSKMFRKLFNLDENRNGNSNHKRKYANQDDEELFDKIQLKKQMLVTLEKEIKDLETNRIEIEAKNQKIKKLWGETKNQYLFSLKDHSESEQTSTKKQYPIKNTQENQMDTMSHNIPKTIKKFQQHVQHPNKSKISDCCCPCSVF